MKNNRVLDLKTALKAIKDMTAVSYIVEVIQDMVNDKKFKGIVSTYYPTNSLVNLIDTLVRLKRAIRSVLVV
jgi:hypothetical protein